MTGKHYNYFRDYDSSIGRYIESDPVGLNAGLNTFGYVASRPLASTDSFGLKDDCGCRQDYMDCLANCIRRYDPLNNLDKIRFTAAGGTFLKRWIGLPRGLGNASSLTTALSAAANAAGGGGAGTLGGFVRGIGRAASPLWVSYGLGLAGLEIFCAADCANNKCAHAP